MKTTDNKAQGRKPQWEKPALVRLGTIRDIAQGPTPLDQANDNKRS